MAPLHSLVIAAAAFLCLISTAVADTLNRTMCYCATPGNETDSSVEAGAYYFFQFHSNLYKVDMAIDYTCRSASWNNVCTMRMKQKQNRCRTYDGGWKFCYHQNSKWMDYYSFNGIKNYLEGVMVEFPKEEVASICDNLCLKHVGLPRILKSWNKTIILGPGTERRGESFIESFPELPDIILPHSDSPASLWPSWFPHKVYLCCLT